MGGQRKEPKKRSEKDLERNGIRRTDGGSEEDAKEREEENV